MEERRPSKNVGFPTFPFPLPTQISQSRTLISFGDYDSQINNLVIAIENLKLFSHIFFQL
jgi:hypothetical protein